ncbi:hypothetical protein Mgra_00001618, partial [Meloidogyne graminicola]
MVFEHYNYLKLIELIQTIKVFPYIEEINEEIKKRKQSCILRFYEEKSFNLIKVFDSNDKVLIIIQLRKEKVEYLSKRSLIKENNYLVEKMKEEKPNYQPIDIFMIERASELIELIDKKREEEGKEDDEKEEVEEEDDDDDDDDEEGEEEESEEMKDEEEEEEDDDDEEEEELEEEEEEKEEEEEDGAKEEKEKEEEEEDEESREEEEKEEDKEEETDESDNEDNEELNEDEESKDEEEEENKVDEETKDEIAYWLTKQFSSSLKYLILIARTKPNENDLFWEYFKQMNKYCIIKIKLCDVTNIKMMKEIFEMPEMVQLNGIVHSAGILINAPIYAMDYYSLNKVIKPKAEGAFLINYLLSLYNLNPIHFIINSSLTSLNPNNGQSAYSSANAFCDSLIRKRRENGYSGTVINWGNWLEVGMAARKPGTNELLNSFGFIGLSNNLALYCFNIALKYQPIQLLIGRFNWKKLKENFKEFYLKFKDIEEENKEKETK